jgi:hypothetical protein
MSQYKGPPSKRVLKSELRATKKSELQSTTEPGLGLAAEPGLPSTKELELRSTEDGFKGLYCSVRRVGIAMTPNFIDLNYKTYSRLAAAPKS